MGKLNDLDGKQWVQYTKSWINISYPRRNKSVMKEHPATFPPELAARFINFFTRKGQCVFDPFCGVGNSLIAAAKLGRESYGIELYPRFAELFQILFEEEHDIPFKDKKTYENYFIYLNRNEWYSAFLTGNSLDILDEIDYEFDFCITSPPYWNMLKKSRGGSKSSHKERNKKGYKTHYGDSDEDLGNCESYKDYLNKILLVFRKTFDKMRDGAYMVVIVQNLLSKNLGFIPMAWDIAYKIRDGIENVNLCQEFIWCQDNKRLGIWGYPSRYISNVHHHYCLVFRLQDSDK